MPHAGKLLPSLYAFPLRGFCEHTLGLVAVLCGHLLMLCSNQWRAYAADGTGARKLWSYLWSIYGHKTLTGQQVSAWSGPRSELDCLQRITGKQPAILGLDYINPERWTFVNDRAAPWYLEEGGIPTICWH